MDSARTVQIPRIYLKETLIPARHGGVVIAGAYISQEFIHMVTASCTDTAVTFANNLRLAFRIASQPYLEHPGSTASIEARLTYAHARMAFNKDITTLIPVLKKDLDSYRRYSGILALAICEPDKTPPYRPAIKVMEILQESGLYLTAIKLHEADELGTKYFSGAAYDPPEQRLAAAALLAGKLKDEWRRSR